MFFFEGYVKRVERIGGGFFRGEKRGRERESREGEKNFFFVLLFYWFLLLGD